MIKEFIKNTTNKIFDLAYDLFDRINKDDTDKLAKLAIKQTCEIIDINIDRYSFADSNDQLIINVDELKDILNEIIKECS